MTLMYGDCLEHMRAMEAGAVDAIITDPHYNLTHEQKFMYHNEFFRICNGIVIVFAPPENQWDMLSSDNSFFKADQIAFWIKPISTKNTSKSYSRFVEMIFVFGRLRWNSKRHWSQYVNVFNDLVEEKEHPYRKPYSLMERLVLNHTDIGDVIYDPFAGSGTTLLAAKNNERECIGSEIDEKYYYMARQRVFGY